MPKDLSYPVIHHKYVCEICGRSFDSGGPWAWRAAVQCEEECREKAKIGLIRVFLPPPGRWDTMFQSHHWYFVEMTSPWVVCAKEGHVEKRSWIPAGTRSAYDADTKIYSRVVVERELVECMRCERSVGEFHGRKRDKGCGKKQ